MRVGIEPGVLELFPQFCRGLVIAKGIDNSRATLELEEMLREAQERLRQDGAVDVATHARLAAWKEAYVKFGANPNKFTPSIVFLAKQVKAGKAIRSISPAVDIFNVISLKYLFPCGGVDVETVAGDRTLARAQGTETVAPLFKPQEVERPEPGEVIYVNRASNRVMCRRWNWRNADFSKIAPTTRSLVINVDGMMPAIGRPEIEQATEELAALLGRFCGGEIAIRYLDAASASTAV